MFQESLIWTSILVETSLGNNLSNTFYAKEHIVSEKNLFTVKSAPKFLELHAKAIKKKFSDVVSDTIQIQFINKKNYFYDS